MREWYSGSGLKRRCKNAPVGPFSWKNSGASPSRADGVARRPGASPSNDCCCLRRLATQPAFAAERSALQMMIENAGHICMFIPKVSSPPYMCIEHVLTIADCLYRPRYALHSSTANSTGSSASGQRRKSTRVAIASTRSLVCVRR